MALPQWLRSIFGLPSPDAENTFKFRPRIPQEELDWREQGRHGESLEEFRLRRASQRPQSERFDIKPGHLNISREPRSRLDDVGRHSTPPARSITPDAAYARQERFDAMYRADDSAYQRARQRELDAYEAGVSDQAMSDFVGDLVQNAAANEAIEEAQDRAERAEERLERALYEREEDPQPDQAYQPQADNAYVAPTPEPAPVYEAPESAYEAPAQPEYQAPEPQYSQPDPAPSYDPGPNSSDNGDNSW